MNGIYTDKVCRLHVSRSFDDVELLTDSYRATPSSCIQTTAGRFGAKIHAMATTRLEIRDVGFDVGVINSISHPTPRLALFLGAGGAARLMDNQLTGSNLGYVNLEQGFIARMQPGSRWCNISFDWGLIHQVAEPHGYVLPGGSYSCQVPPAAHKVLLAMLTQVVRNQLFAELSDDELEDELARICLRVLSAPQLVRSEWRIDHLRAIHRVLDFIHTEYSNPITVTSLCQLVGVSERVLQYKFKETMGCSIQQYLLSYRLHRARSMLLLDTKRQVNEVASACGIHHAGRFSQYYRRLFGGSPRDLLTAPKRLRSSRSRSNLLHQSDNTRICQT